MSAKKEILMKFITTQNEKVRKDVSMQGYKDNSPYRNNPFNFIYGTPDGTNITMKGVSVPVLGIDELGNKQQMMPGQDYFFPGSRVREEKLTMQSGGQSPYTVTMDNPFVIQPQGMLPIDYYQNLPKNEAGIPYDKDGTLFTQSKVVSRYDENGKPLSSAQIRENQKMWNMQKIAYSPEQQTFNLWKNNPQNTAQGYYSTREYDKYLKSIVPKGKDVGLDGLCDPNFSSTKCGTSKQHAKEDKKEWSKKQEGGEKDFTNVQEWFNKYIDSPLYRRNIENSGYENVDDVIAQRKANVNRTGYELDENRLGTYYKNTSNKIHNAPKTDSKNWSKKYPSVLPNDSVLAHEFGHAVLDSNQSWFGSLKPFWNKNDYDQLESRNKNKRVSRGAMENYADQKELQYTAAKLGIYNPGFEEFTEEHLDKLPTDLKDRALQNYSKEDLIWLMNNIAQNNDNSNDQLAIAQRGGATRADSLDVYNRALKIDAYYEKLRKKGWYKKPKIEKVYSWVTSDYLTDEMKKIDKESRKTYKKQSEEDKDYSYLTNAYPNTDVKTANLKALKEHIALTKGTKYATKDNLPSVIDPIAPTTVIDTRIIPKERVIYEKSGDMNDYRTTPPGGSATSLYRYDPLSVKPWDMLTDAEKKLRVEKYGTDGVPKSYLNKNKQTEKSKLSKTKLINVDTRGVKGKYDNKTKSIFGTLNPKIKYEQVGESLYRPINDEPILQPKVKALNIQPIEQTPINFPIQQIDTTPRFVEPKSFNISSHRTNMQGVDDYYSYIKDSATYEEALKAQKASDAYNKYIQEKYGNEEALKNPKAVERLKQLKSEFKIESNYKFGGDLYQYQNGSQTWDKQKQNLKNEKLEKLKRLLSLPDPVFKAKTFEEKIAEKIEQEKRKPVAKDNTATRGYNNASIHSNAARNKTDKEIADERRQIRQQSDANVLNSYSLEAFKPSNYTRENLSEMAKGLESKFRVSDEPNFFDDYLNPFNMIGGMASNLGQAPLQAKESDSYLPYVTSIGAPLILGAAAGLGTTNNAQFINNIVNPVAGADDLLKGIAAPKNILVDEHYMGSNAVNNAINDVKSTRLPSNVKLNELRDAVEHGEQWKYPDMNFAEEIARLKKSAKTEADIAYIDALEKQYDFSVSWHDAARNRANPVFLTGQSLEDMINPLFKNPEGDQWFAMQQFRHTAPKGKHFGYMADEADYIHASKYRLPGNRFDTESMMKDIGEDASIYFNERYKPLSPDFKNLPLNQKGGLVNFLQKAQEGKTVTVDYGDNIKKKILTDSREYSDLFNEKRIGVKNDDGSISVNPLDEVVITPYDKQYPFYQELSDEEKKYFNSDTPIGRQLRSRAQDNVGFNADKASDFAYGWIRDLPLASLQAPQSALVETVEALRGNDFNMLNALEPDKQRIPSETWGVENPYAAFAVDAFTDPEILMGMSLLKNPLQKGLQQTGEYLTTKTPLQNAYKYNPWAFKPNPEAYYRQVFGEEASKSPIITRTMHTNNDPKGIEAFIEAKPYGFYKGNSDEILYDLELPFTSLSSNDALPYFNKSRPYYSDNFFKGKPKETLIETNFSAKDYEDFYPGAMRIISVDPNNEGIKRFGDVRVLSPFSKEGHNLENYNIYKKDWLRGYKPIETPNVGKSFKSEIDWGKWNKEILENKSLMDEYHTIEQQTKANGTWMKNSDGSPFQGTPEQFVQQNSENFKKAFPNGINKVYRGVGPANNNPDFSKGFIEGDKAIFTADKELAQNYAWGKQKENILTPFSSSTDSGIYELGFPKGDQINYNTMLSDWTDINLAKGSSKLNLEMNLEQQKKALKQYLKNYEGSVDDDLISHTENRIKQLEQYIRDFDNIPTNHEELKKMRSILGDTPSTDDIAAYLPKTNLNNITLQNVIDGGLGDVTIVNNRVGNYLKSLRGNNGMFDMTNPNIYKSILPVTLGIGAVSQLEKKPISGMKQGGYISFDEYYRQNVINPRNKS